MIYLSAERGVTLANFFVLIKMQPFGALIRNKSERSFKNTKVVMK